MVDDAPGIRARLLALLQEVDGVQTLEARDAAEGLALLRAHGADVVVLDLHMPGRSGLDVLRDIKATVPSPTVVVLTSHPTELHRRMCLERGADHFFDKAREFARVLDVLVRPTAARS